MVQGYNGDIHRKRRKTSATNREYNTIYYGTRRKKCASSIHTNKMKMRAQDRYTIT